MLVMCVLYYQYCTAYPTRYDIRLAESIHDTGLTHVLRYTSQVSHSLNYTRYVQYIFFIQVYLGNLFPLNDQSTARKDKHLNFFLFLALSSSPSSLKRSTRMCWDLARRNKMRSMSTAALLLLLYSGWCHFWFCKWESGKATPVSTPHFTLRKKSDIIETTPSHQRWHAKWKLS